MRGTELSDFESPETAELEQIALRIFPHMATPGIRVPEEVRVTLEVCVSAQQPTPPTHVVCAGNGDEQEAAWAEEPEDVGQHGTGRVLEVLDHVVTHGLANDPLANGKEFS